MQSRAVSAGSGAFSSTPGERMQKHACVCAKAKQKQNQAKPKTKAKQKQQQKQKQKHKQKQEWAVEYMRVSDAQVRVGDAQTFKPKAR